MRRQRERGRPDLPVSELQLATLVKQAPEGDGWVHEIKFDGYRICAVLEGGAVRLYTRRFLDWTDSMAPIAAAVATLPAGRAILDGEVCALLPDGRSTFLGLHEALASDGAELVYMVFDLLSLEGEDLTPLPLETRKARLAALVAPAGKKPWQAHVRYSDHIAGSGGDFFRVACERGLEGIISKQLGQPYRPGRGNAWVKTKCLQRQELVIGGYSEPSGARSGFGALLVGHFEDGALRYAGKVGTGFNAASLDELYAAMTARETATCPFSPVPPRIKTGPGVHWVRPELVVEVAFMEWTPDGALRHPSFQGLRRDKPARDVRRERPAPPPR
jgi:bifunctional non-homologous end joining protein LigD